VACNAITGAASLAVCEGAECATDPTLPPDRNGGALDGGPDANEPLPETCTSGEKRCSGNLAATCVGGRFQTTPCAESCLAGDCAPRPSCRNPVGATCGTPAGSCCESLAVPGGTFKRDNDAAFPATLTDYRLDKYEVTVARLRAFVEDNGGHAGNAPGAGAGAHPKIPNSGWLADWNPILPPSTAALKSSLAGGTWTDAPGDNELKPITRVSWFVAFAFCAWDGGRLPTNAEWGFAASGGEEQRVYPWSSPADSTTIDYTYAAYNCAVTAPAYSCTTIQRCSVGLTSPCDATACATAGGTCQPYTTCSGCSGASDVAKVGTYPKGAGRWGHLDLAGNAREWVLDQAGNRANIVLPTPCVDCANLVPANPEGPRPDGSDDVYMIQRGGSWTSISSSPATAATYLRNTRSDTETFDETTTAAGFRCARD
jgi:formylglycine-generating enzyme